ncbi:hypothetical protein LZZ90_00515 [Flavobacterium sp. SM15]|uniref:hypothetical protein n=1 Tax=Flavobacterium sp. SM15 TaxID=2908005 RepID=UPI001EDC65B7|nr:hypothetical protein [Flavobacterium sp. SM15]MCG2609984.1 hypothetical protein [Flavobacterium sp. SM15]
MDKYELGRKVIEDLNCEFKSLDIEKFNEADTRFRFIDTILTQCLEWDLKDINNEDVKDGNYADYKLNLFRPVAVLEAKRVGNYFELPVGKKKIIMPLKSICKDNPNIKAALLQVSGYCHERGIQIGIISNGWQIIAFIANRNDSISPLDGVALVIPSLEVFLNNYKEVWNCLSKIGFQEEYLTKKLVGSTEEVLPPKLSSTITDYPGIKNRNPFQVDLEILSDLVLEDIIREKSIEKDFLSECYCKSGSLSQYSILSKQILSTRYTYLFESNDKKATLDQIATKKGISGELLELFANSMSKRPILLIGDVGVGKSTFIDNLLLVEAPQVFEKSITFKIDLGSKAIISLDVRVSIIKIIKEQLQDLYNIDINDDDFVRHAYFSELANFKKSVQVKRLYEIDLNKAIEKEIDFLSELVSDEITHIKKSLEHISKNQKKQIIVFIDNCDQRNDNDQETAFLVSQEFAADWPVVAFLCLRPETFHRTKKKEGALSGYHPKAFTIAPPRIDEVIIRRLSFAQKITSGEIHLSNLQNKTSFSKLDELIECFKESLEVNHGLYKFFENVSNGNIRIAIELIKKFFGSGHVDTEKILNIIETTGNYTIPVHEVLRSVIFGDNIYYSPSNLEITNIFDVRTNDSKDHFTISFILGILNDCSVNNRNEGFIEITEIYSQMQKIGYIPSTIDLALNFMYSKGLFETSEKGNVLNIEKNNLKIRATGTGIYHLNYLINSFTYVDAIIVDTPIFDIESRGKITNSHDINKRLERTKLFTDYLDGVWKENNFQNSHFLWTQKSKELREDIDKIIGRVKTTHTQP